MNTDIMVQWTGLRESAVKACAQLLEQGNTVPFIARYRKDVTGGLSETEIRQVEEAVQRWSDLENRRQTVLSTIESQGLLTDELKQKLLACTDRQELEDLYLPYRPQRTTRASVARKAGLEPLARRMLGLEPTKQGRNEEARAFVDEKKGVPDPETALQGARDIVAELVSIRPETRQKIREWGGRTAHLVTKKKRGAKGDLGAFEDYFDHREPLVRLPPHRLLAVLRGEQQEALSVSLEVEEPLALGFVSGPWGPKVPGIWKADVLDACDDGFHRLLWPAIERELLAQAKESADRASVRVFQENLRSLLMSPPLRGKTVCAMDPGFRHGCKMAVVSPTAAVLATGTVYPHPPQEQKKQAAELLVQWQRKHGVEVVAVGDGTAHRETLAFLADVPWPTPTRIESVSEAGASVYSASPIAVQELPDMDVTLRGAVSIARRLQDPLAELVKVDPRSIGVGQYQHDIDPKMLAEGLDGVVEDCVNQVGVELNTASAPLLSRVAGIGPKLAGSIVAHRSQNGPFASRGDLRKVAGLGPARFTQCAGFLRIPDSRQPLDATGIHPESYDAVTSLAKGASVPVTALLGNAQAVQKLGLAGPRDTGLLPRAFADILAELEKPGRDPRGERVEFRFSDRVHSVEDLKPGMVLPGKVTNVTDFGAFVDIGVHRDGLVHISQLADRRVASPFDVVKPQQAVTVKVIEVDARRNRISLTMRPSDMGSCSAKAT